MNLEYISLNQVEISNFNVRKDNVNEGLSELADNIREHTL